MDTLLVVSIIGAAIDVLPWFLYDISETGQKSMIRVIRIRTLVEDNGTENLDDGAYIEGCEAVFKAKKYYGLEKDATTKDILKQAKALPSTTEAEKELRSQAIKNAKERLAKAEEHNEEIEIADFVVHELTRFENDFGKKQIELCRLIVSGGPQNFYQCAEEAQRLAIELPISEIKEERTWRKQEIRNAKALLKSEKLARKYYPDGIVPFDNQDYEDAYNLPDGTREEAKLRRKLMRKLSKERDRYGVVAAPYLSAKRTLDLYEGYKNIDEITADYETVVNNRNERLEKERKEQERLEQERRNDRKGKEASRRLRK
jgi:hypothetical protein